MSARARVEEIHARVEEIEGHLPALERQFTDRDVDFIVPLGDNWLAAWEWASDLEREHGIDHQRALRVAYGHFFDRPA